MATMLVLAMFSEPALSDYVNITSGETASAAEAGAAGYTYVSDIRLYQGNGRSRDAIVKLAAEEGYTIFSEKEVPVNLKETTEHDAVYVGYKTTDDEDEAIRSLKTLEMKRGYEWFDYQKIAEGQMEKMETVASDLAIAVNEFKRNLKNGSESARYAKDYLNYMYFTLSPPPRQVRARGL